MIIQEMINTWRNGCSCSMTVKHDGTIVRHDPWTCQSCTEGLIEAISTRMRDSELLRNADEAQQFLNKSVTK